MLPTRSLTEEQMDAAELDPVTYAAILRDLARVNTLTMARRPTIAFLNRVRRARPNARLKILDVGFGDGDMLRAIHSWAQQSATRVELVGVDLNPKSAIAARESTPAGVGVTFLSGDYAELANQGWDVILSSLVAHHMSHAQLVDFLRFMAREAKAGWLINDLHRHGFAYLGFPLLARLMRSHRIVREDGTLSIARSFRPPEWPPILAEAGINTARVYRAFPFRLCVDHVLS